MHRLLFSLMLLPAVANADVPTVATDIAPVHSMVAQVMKGVGEPKLVIPPGASPHGYAMRPSEARALSTADLVVWVGPSLTPWLSDPLDTLAGEARRLMLMETPGMTLYPFREGAGFEAHDHEGHGHGEAEEHDGEHEEHEERDGEHKEHKDEHAEHDGEHKEHAEHDGEHKEHAEHDGEHKEHAEHDGEHKEHSDHEGNHADHAGEEGRDPHIWLDPANAAVGMAAIAEALAQMDPANAETYFANAQEGDKRLADLSLEIEQMLAGLSGLPFLVFHDAFHYFEARFEVEATGSVSAGDAAKPGAARISELRAHIAETGAYCAFAEPQMNTDLMQTVVEGQETKLATLDPLGASLALGPDLYPDMLRAMARDLAACLTR